MSKYVIVAVLLNLIPVLGLCAEPVARKVENQGFIGRFYVADEITSPKLGILYLCGSEGGIPQNAKWVARGGYPILGVAYFGVQGTPQTLNMIPLEYFKKPLDWLLEQKETIPNGLVVIGGSKGAELGLLLASREPRIKGVIALSPSSVVFQGIPNPQVPGSFVPMSSWSLGGKPVPYVPYDYSQGFNFNDLLSFYRLALKQEAFVEQAGIAVEKINGPILLFSGVQDSIWPSADMGDMICERLKKNDFSHPYEHHKYKNAGHTLTEYYVLGGTEEGNKAARLDLTPRIFAFLELVNKRLSAREDKR